MTETNDSQPSADLPLWGRVELDLLAGEVALWDFEIAELEYPSPADNTARCAYLKQLVTVAQAGLLGDGCQFINRSPWSPGNMAYRDERFSSWRIPREVYRQWRAIQSNRPTSSAIAYWLGTPASIEPASAVTVLDASAAAKHAALESLLAEIDKRAVEQGAGFDRHSLPGTKQEFHRLLNAYHPPFGYMNTQNLADEYLKGKCQFQRGAKPKQGKGKAIWTLFPEYPLK